MSCNEWKESVIGRIPYDWEIRTIEDIKSNSKNAIAMGPFGSRIKSENFVSEGVPVIRGVNLSKGKLLEEEYVFLTEEKADELKSSNVFEGDIVFTHRGTLGQVGIIPKDSKYRKYIVSQSQMKLSCNKELVEPEWVYYFFKSKYGQHQLLSNTSTTGVPAIGRPTTTLKLINIPIPPKKEQINVIKILNSLEDKIVINESINKTLEEMAQALFKRWFVDFEFPNENGEPYKSSGGEMVESELGMIPKGWEVKKLGEVIENIVDNRGKTPPRDEFGIPLIEGNNITMFNTYINTTSKQKYVNEDTYNTWFRSGHPEYLDILCATVGTLPKWCFVGKNDKICIAQNIIALRAKKEIISPYYLKNYMDTNAFIQMFNGRITTTAQPSIKVGHLTSIKIIMPKYKEVKLYDKLVNDIYELVENRKIENKQLEELRNTLLPKLMSGEIRVK